MVTYVYMYLCIMHEISIGVLYNVCVFLCPHIHTYIHIQAETLRPEPLLMDARKLHSIAIFISHTYIHTYIHTYTGRDPAAGASFNGCTQTSLYSHTYSSHTYIHTYIHIQAETLRPEPLLMDARKLHSMAKPCGYEACVLVHGLLDGRSPDVWYVCMCVCMCVYV
jgi:hypothetical protein